MHVLTSGYTILSVIWINIIVFLLALASKQIELFSLKSYRFLSTPPLIELKPPLIDLLTLGHRGLYHDFANIWALQFMVDKQLEKEKPEEVFNILKKITAHQPKLESFYMISCFTLAFDLKRPDLCEAITFDGLKAFPDSWRIPMTQGYIFAFELKNPSRASIYYHLASSRKRSPPYVASLTQKMLKKERLSQDEIEHIVQLLAALPGGEKLVPSFKENLKERLKSSGGSE